MGNRFSAFFQKKGVGKFLVLSLLVAAVPVTVYNGVREQQDLRQHAAGGPTPTNAFSIFNRAVTLNGTSYLKAAGGSINQDTSKDFTIELWLRPAAISSPGFGESIITKQSDNFRSLDYRLLQFKDKDGKGQVQFGFGGASGYEHGSEALLSQTVLEKDKWYHVAVVKKGLVLRLFINGNLDAQVRLPKNVTTTNYPISVGASFNYEGQISEPLIGTVDEMRLSNVARYTTAFNPPKGPFPLTTAKAMETTQALFHFDDTFTNAVTNSTMTFNGTPVFDVSTIPSVLYDPYVSGIRSSTYLPGAIVGQEYEAVITGVDRNGDQNNNLTMELEGFPSTIILDPTEACNVTTNVNNLRVIQCKIVGTPTEAKVYPVKIKVRNSSGYLSVKEMKFVVGANTSTSTMSNVLK